MVEVLTTPNSIEEPGVKDSDGWASAFDTGVPQAVDAPANPEVTLREFRVMDAEGEWRTIVSPEKRTGRYLNLQVRFETDSFRIPDAHRKVLKELAKALKDPRLKDRRVHLNGHTDSDGKAAYNLELSMKRALAVKTCLVEELGISADRLAVYGYGEAMPLVPETGPREKQINRRVEIVIPE
jgi:outer membrane protein OmpA-like peptidoglycan-associated protein